ncbi:MAG: chromate efflux transporter [Pseudomonadota bacterium]
MSTRDDERTGGQPFPTLREAVPVWARIALLSFGGPAGQIAVMHRILVEEKRWIGDDRFLQALNFCMLLPGPEAQQLATYIGWLLHRKAGGLIAGIFFVLPGALAIMALSVVYALHSSVGPVQAIFFGLKAAVLAIVFQALIRVAGRALNGPAMTAIALGSFVAIFVFAVPFPIIIAAAGLIGLCGGLAGSPAFRPQQQGAAGKAHLADNASAIGAELPQHAQINARDALATAIIVAALWLIPVALLPALAGGTAFADIAAFFATMAVVTFGGAYAVLAYVAQEAVGTYGWLAPGEMLDGLGMAETTPGPLIMVTQFVGFMGAFRDPGALPPVLAGVLGGLLTTWVTFVPCFLWVFVGAPFMERLRANLALAAALTAITAAVVGVILNLAIWFAMHVIFAEVRPLDFGLIAPPVPVWSTFDPMAALLSAAALVAVFALRLGMLTVLSLAAVGGLLMHFAGFV